MLHHGDTHLMDLPAWQLRDLIARRVVTPLQAVSASLERIKERNGILNAFVHVCEYQALQDAKALTERMAAGSVVGPLAGVPVGVKDLENVAGLPTSYGSQAHAHVNIAEKDSIQVARLRAADAIIIGKTNTPLMGYIGVTKNIPFGATANPWNISRSSGGSSGGSASAVAGGLVPIVTASDGGGSIRIPAALCGAFGLKPTRGLIPVEEGFGMVAWLRMSYQGPITRCVRDAALYMDVVSGYHAADISSVPALPTMEPTIGVAPRRLRVAVSMDMGGTVHKIQSDIRACVEQVAARLADMGHEVTVLTSEQFHTPSFGEDWGRAVGAQTWAKVGELWAEHVPKLDRNFVKGWDQAKHFDVHHLAALHRKIHSSNAQIQTVFDSFDVLLTPALGLEAYPKKGPVADTIEGTSVSVDTHFQFMQPFNYSGHPACVFRAGMTNRSLPCAVQLVADRYQDALLLQLSAAYEARYNPMGTWPNFPMRSKL